MKDYEFRPTAQIFPLLKPDSIRFEELVESIRSNGLRVEFADVEAGRVSLFAAGERVAAKGVEML
jgi:hypothetical protein